MIISSQGLEAEGGDHIHEGEVDRPRFHAGPSGTTPQAGASHPPTLTLVTPHVASKRARVECGGARFLSLSAVEDTESII